MPLTKEQARQRQIARGNPDGKAPRKRLAKKTSSSTPSESWTVVELKAHLKKLGLPVSGTKAVLLGRIRGSSAGRKSPVKTPKEVQFNLSKMIEYLHSNGEEYDDGHIIMWRDVYLHKGDIPFVPEGEYDVVEVNLIRCTIYLERKDGTSINIHYNTVVIR
jgi:hypothetical protein